MEQVGMSYVAVQDVGGRLRVLVISFVKMVIARDIDDFHHSVTHEGLTALSWKTFVKVKLLFQRSGVVIQDIMENFLLGTSQYDRFGGGTWLILKCAHVFIRSKTEPSNREVLTLKLVEVAYIADKDFFVSIHPVTADKGVIVLLVLNLIWKKNSRRK